MTVVKQAVFLLLLVAVATYADHNGDHPDQKTNGDPPADANDKANADPPAADADHKADADPPAADADHKADADPPAADADHKANADPPAADANDKAHADPPAADANDKAHADPAAADANDKAHADPAAADANREAQADSNDCANRNRELQTKDLHKAFGDWVLVHSVADRSAGSDVLENVTSSRIELLLDPDNKSVLFKEWNKMKDGSCANYFLKTSLVENRAADDHHTLPISGYHLEDGEGVKWHNNTGEMHFYQNHDDLLHLVYKTDEYHFLLNYRREGTHSDAALLRADDDQHDRQARCLKFSHERAFRYDGAADFCDKKTPELHHQDQHDHHDQHDHQAHHDDAKQAEPSA